MSGNLHLTPNQRVLFLVMIVVIIGVAAVAVNVMPRCLGGCLNY